MSLKRDRRLSLSLDPRNPEAPRVDARTTPPTSLFLPMQLSNSGGPKAQFPQTPDTPSSEIRRPNSPISPENPHFRANSLHTTGKNPTRPPPPFLQQERLRSSSVRSTPKIPSPAPQRRPGPRRWPVYRCGLPGCQTVFSKKIHEGQDAAVYGSTAGARGRITAQFLLTNVVAQWRAGRLVCRRARRARAKRSSLSDDAERPNGLPDTAL
jgi:hypothetical protein